MPPPVRRVPRIPMPRFIRPAAASQVSSAPPLVMPASSKIGPVSAPNRNVATAPTPQAEQGRAESRTYVQTYFTKVSDETAILYNGDRQWARVTLELETAGPVVFGTVQNLTPVLSGKGIKLITNEERTITVAKGTRLYIASTSVNRVQVTVEPLPWLEQITATLRDLVARWTR